MKIRVTIEEFNGIPISTFMLNDARPGSSVVAAATQADYLMTHGFSWEECQRLVGGYMGVRCRVEVLDDEDRP